VSSPVPPPTLRPGALPARIAVYLPSLAGGGAEKTSVTLANEFARRGYLVDLVLVKARGAFLADVSPSVRIVDLLSRGVVLSTPGLVSYLRSARPEAMLSVMDHANVIAIVARWIARVDTRLVVSVHGVQLFAKNFSRVSRAGLVLMLARLLYAKSDAILSVSEGLADKVAAALELPRLSINVVYNPIDVKKISDLADDRSERHLHDGGDKPFLLAAGRLKEVKDFKTLIRAFAKVRKELDVNLIIIGEGAQRLELEAEVSRLGLGNQVMMPGFISNPFPLMRQSSVFVLSSTSEGLSLVLLEAMACGTQVVSTDCPYGPSEILANGRWGRLVPVGDYDALAQAILATLRDRTPPEVVSRAASFGLDAAVEGYLRLLMPSRPSR